jgi:glycosyltransferase involved in cell wall biosynthesis
MRILFIHQNFPGQFKNLAPAMAARGHDVTALTVEKNVPADWRGVRVVPYRLGRNSAPNIHPWVLDFETKVIRAEAAFRMALKLREQGYTPDVIVAHHGWGECLFVKDVWPKARLGVYCEFFYQAQGADHGFDPEFHDDDPGEICRLRLKNLGQVLHFDIADAALAPTAWQAGTFPRPFRDTITVVHEGIDTAALKPDPGVSVTLKTDAAGALTLTKADEIITFVNRNLEPSRGYHIFMRALPEILRRRPHAHVLIVGSDRRGYGATPKDGQSWKAVFAREVRPRIPDADWARVHFLGRIPYLHFVRMLQMTTVHVYLTYPFVLSWSVLEAMSVGAAIVASDTAPVSEVIRHDETGRLFDFFDVQALVDEVCTLLDDPGSRARLGANARAFARAHYDLERVCLPRQLEWIEQLAAHGPHD